jgi:hypothetical protein
MCLKISSVSQMAISRAGDTPFRFEGKRLICIPQVFNHLTSWSDPGRAVEMGENRCQLTLREKYTSWRTLKPQMDKSQADKE